MSKNRNIETDPAGMLGGSESDLPTGLAKPALRALHGAGYTEIHQISKLTESELLQLHGMGPKALNQLRRALTEKGLSFASES
ncbi:MULTISPECIES: DNA-binding protein [unclassified Paenibacillus]|uniref:DNA-binding protein n=1 Tax=unclassified Paenibacillus TaxID=185978 RepID=UPI000AC22EA5|nr:DNA-binding protein [Paenibacillus sp. FSL R5-0345]